MSTNHLKVAAIAWIAAALAGCAGGANYHVQTAPGHPVSDQAMLDEVYLDGTGPTARRMAIAPSPAVEQRQVAAPQPGGPTRAIVRTRPTAIPAEGADEISAGTTGTRNSARGESSKPFSDQWWEKERREDARLRSRMNICSGC